MKLLLLVSAGGAAMLRSVRDAIADAAGTHELRMLAPDVEAKALRDTGVPTESWRPAGLFNVLRSINALRRAVERYEPDAVHAFGWTAAAVALGALPARYAARTRVTLQDPVRDKEMPKNFLERRVPDLLMRAGTVECAYDTLRRVLVDVLGVASDKVSVVPYGVAALTEPGIARPPGRRGPIVGYAGRIDADRAWETAVDAMTGLVRVAPDAQLWFARRGKIAGLVRAHARTAGVIDALTFFEDLPVAELFAGIDVLIVPGARDGLPYPLVEALVSGIPVVGANAGGIADTLKPFEGWLVDDDAPGFVAGLTAAWAEIDHAWEAAQAQRLATAERFSPEARKAHGLATYARLAAQAEDAAPASRASFEMQR